MPRENPISEKVNESSPPITTNPMLLREAMARRLYSQAEVKGQIILFAVPSLVDEYVEWCADLFAGVGRKFSDEDLAQFRKLLEGQLIKAHAASQRAKIVITYQTSAGKKLRYHIKGKLQTVEEAYEDWIGSREPPLFGTHPDARVWALAEEAADPSTHPVLDIGAGTGRNALALARRGHPVDAVELTPKFAEILRSDAERESLNVRVIQHDILAASADLRKDYQLILCSEVVNDFRTTQQVRGLMEIAARCLAPGGRFVFNIFLARQGYRPDDAARELGQQTYSSIFTRYEVSGAAAELPLELVANDSVYEYEKAHLPEGAWPQTSWYERWVSGRDVFEVEREESPIELRWLVYRKTG